MKHLTLLLILFTFVLAMANGQNVQDTSLIDSNKSLVKKDKTLATNVTDNKDNTILVPIGIKSLNRIIELPSSVNTAHGGILILPSRPDATESYQDAIKVPIGDSTLRQSETTQEMCSRTQCYKRYIPLLSPINNDRTFKIEELRNLPTRNINEIVSLTAGVQNTSNGLSFRGSRVDGTAYYLDGMRLIGNNNFIESL